MGIYSFSSIFIDLQRFFDDIEIECIWNNNFLDFQEKKKKKYQTVLKSTNLEKLRERKIIFIMINN